MLDFLFSGKIVEEKQSSYNNTIQVIKFLGQYRIVAGGLLQSGGIIKQIWQKPLKKIARTTHPKSVLLLGLGGGTVVKLINKHWPKAKITAIEIDPVMIDFAKKYFNCRPNQQLSIINTDAFTWIKSSKQKFNLVLVDLFQGSTLLKKVYAKDFLDRLAKHCNHGGTVMFNHLFYGDYNIEAEKLINILNTICKQITLVRNLSNLFIICRYD